MAYIPIAVEEVSLSSSSDSDLSAPEDLTLLSDYVKALTDSLAKLERVFAPYDRDMKTTIRVTAHERLGEVLKVLRQILEKYPKIQTNQLLMSAANLIQEVKNFNYEDHLCDRTPFVEAVDQVTKAFSSSSPSYNYLIAPVPKPLSPASLSSSSELELSPGEDLSVLTEYVKAFRESLVRLKRTFRSDRDTNATIRVTAHERLGDVLKVLRQILEKYPKIQSSELLVSAGNLIQQVKYYQYESRRPDTGPFMSAVEHLAKAFSARVAMSAQSDASEVPLIVQKCVEEIDSRGATTKGIYRVSGVKSRVEQLCQSLESGHELVDLSGTPPNVIANVLKLYLRQLPEPLLTYRLYPEFIEIAKAFPAPENGEICYEDELEVVARLRRVLSLLPKVHYNTLALLMRHLRRVSEMSHENNMPSSNLGIVFGPTLLRNSESDASYSSLVDTVHQSRIIDLMVTYAHQVFGPEVQEKSPEELIESSTKQSKLFKSATCVTISGQKVVTGNYNNDNYKQSLVEARRQFFTTPASPPQYRIPLTPPTTPMSGNVSPFSQSISSSMTPTQHQRLKRSSSSQQQIHNQPNAGHELTRSATHAFTFNRNNADMRQYKYI